MNYECPNERLKDFVLNIKTYFKQEKNTVIYNKRNVIKIVDFEGKRYVVKSFKIPHLLNQVVYRFFRDSKARRSFDNSYKLEKMGINTPQPVGYIEFPTHLQFKESFYISEFYDFDFEIRAVFADKNFEDRENILEKFIEFSYKLHQKNVYHIDYSPGNILIKKNTYGYEFSIIDVNRMNFVEFDDALRMKSLSKLTNNKNDIDFMIKYYAKISNKTIEELTPLLENHIAKQQAYLNRKKTLKKLKGKHE